MSPRVIASQVVAVAVLISGIATSPNLASADGPTDGEAYGAADASYNPALYDQDGSPSPAAFNASRGAQGVTIHSSAQSGSASVGIERSGMSSANPGGAVSIRQEVSTRSGAGSAGMMDPERRAASLAHYARARTMLLESLAEFERARDIARPDLLIDGEQWRNNVISRAQELDRVLNPQPRSVAGGVALPNASSLTRETAVGGREDKAHAALSRVKTPVGARVEVSRGRLAGPAKAVAPKVASKTVDKPAQVKIEKTSELEAPAAEYKSTETVSTIRTEVKESAVEPKLSERKVEKKVVEKVTETKSAEEPLEFEEAMNTKPATINIEKSTSTKEVSVESGVGAIRIEKSEAAASGSGEAKPLSESELRDRLKKLAEEVQAAEEKSGKSDVSPVGGMAE
ncbi:MAG: hypothetical protein IT290_03080 [Deltaproteobacteria bacterium]|nr:hypothetical protein [Deltaproteobacteria bacterium]